MHRVHAAYLGGLSTRLADHISVAYAQMSHRRKKKGSFIHAWCMAVNLQKRAEDRKFFSSLQEPHVSRDRQLYSMQS